MESFAGMLLRHRGRTALTQRELALRVGVSRRSIQDWESGVSCPDAQHLRALITVLFVSGSTANAHEAADAGALWAAALRESPRMRTAFDADWFTGFRAASVESRPGSARLDSPATRAVSDSVADWSEAPDVLSFHGRIHELATLHAWLLDAHCRLVAILGIGGIGKTMLAARLAHEVAPAFQRVLWQSMRNAPPVDEWLGRSIAFLSDQQLAPPAGHELRVEALLGLLRGRRCLLVLDNLETLMAPGERAGRYREGYDGYGHLLSTIGRTEHQSCVLLTSREAPPELAAIGRRSQALELTGLGTTDARALLEDKGLFGDDAAWSELTSRCGGNALALRIVGETIRQVFGGSLSRFSENAGSSIVFGDTRRLLEEQVARSSALELRVLTRLAVEREPIAVSELMANLGPAIGRGATLEAIEALRHRSLIERTAPGALFTLQSVILEFMTERLVDQIAQEIGRQQPDQLQQQLLVRAAAKDYVRRAQERLIGQPVVERLLAVHGAVGAERRLLRLLDSWRGDEPGTQGFGPGNVLNLLRLLRGHLRALDLSDLVIRHAYLAEAEAQDASLAGATLVDCVLAESFNYPTSVALSADGAYLAAGTSMGEVCLWRVADHTLMLSAQGHAGTIWALALSGDGQLLASGGIDGTAKLWEVRSGRPVVTLHGEGGVQTVVLSADGRWIAVADLSGSIRVWEIASAELVVELAGHTGAIWSLALSANGQLAASAGLDGTVLLWQLPSGRRLNALQAHGGPVYSISLRADGQVLASANEDGTVKLWDTVTGEALASLSGHTGAVYAVAMRADGQVLVSRGEDGTVRLWDVASRRLLANLPGFSGDIYSLALSADGQVLATCAADGTLQVWETTQARLSATLLGYSRGVLGVALSADGQVVASASEDGALRLWSGTDKQPLLTLRGEHEGIRSVALSTDGQVVASGSVDGTVEVWDATGQLRTTLQGRSAVVRALAWSADGKLLAGGSWDGTIRLWETPGGRLLTTVRDNYSVYTVALSGDGQLVATGNLDGEVRVWDTSSGRLLVRLSGHTARVRSVALSVDGYLLASGSLDTTVKLWDLRTAQLLTTLAGHTGGVCGVALSADGQWVARGSLDGAVKLWDAPTGRLVHTLTGHEGGVLTVALSADGRVLASGSFDGAVTLWDVGSGACIRTMRPDRRYERMDITRLTGASSAQKAALIALGAVESGRPLAAGQSRRAPQA